MSEETYFATAYSFPIDSANAFATLRLGRRRYRVEVADFSWAGFTVSAPKKWSKRFKSGVSGTLSHQGSVHPISVTEVSISSDNQIRVSLARQDGVPQTRRSAYGPSKSISRSVNQADPVLTVASGLCILLLVLAMPGWGDSWGTSYYFTDGVNTIGQAFYDAYRSVLSR
jgi:hypothetical protein